MSWEREREKLREKESETKRESESQLEQVGVRDIKKYCEFGALPDKPTIKH